MNLAQQGAANSEFGEVEVKDIVIRAYTIVGSLQGIGQSSVQVEAREALIPDRHVAVYSAKLEFSTGGDYPQSAVTSIQYENIPTFVAMLRKLETATISAERFKFSEIEYEIDDCKAIVFNTDRGALMAALTSGGISVHLNTVAKIGAFADLLTRAKEIIDQHKYNV